MLKKHLIRSGIFGYGCMMLLPNPAEVRSQATQSTRTTFLVASAMDTSIQAINADTPRIFSAAITAAAPALRLNRQASEFVTKYLQRETEFLVKTRARSAVYFRIIDRVFEQYGLPLELRYLAVVESDLKPTAKSRMGARGLWQLMPETGRDYGLKVNGSVDERTHSYKSTVAAAKYIKGLYAEFNDWLLVVAAYNGGVGSVRKAIRKSGSKSFWALQRYLPKESQAHVKRYIATHVFFEGKPGATTVTRNEFASYKKLLDAYYAGLTPASADSLVAIK